MRLLEYLETNNKLGDMQNGFRKKRSTSDSLFIVTQLIEISQRTKTPLFVAFLDIKGAYDNVNRNILWNKMNKLNIPDTFIKLIQKTYSNITNEYKLNNLQTSRIPSTKGVRQGCPMSSILFLIYLQELEQKLNSSEHGFPIGHDTPLFTPFICYGTFYADDIAIFADSADSLKEMLELVTNFGTDHKLTFCENKSKIMIFNPSHNNSTKFYLQHKEIAITTEIDYLGVKLTSLDPDYLKLEEEIRIKKAKKKSAIIKSHSKGSFNRPLVTRTLWKQVAVPSITYADEALCFNPELRNKLEKMQINTGKFALGANYLAPHAAIEGEMGWSHFLTREAKAKNNYAGKLHHTEEGSTIKKIFNYTNHHIAKTKWQNRTLKLRTKYGIGTNRINHDTNNKWKTEVNKQCTIVNEERWKKDVEKKQSLKLYRNKKHPSWEAIYDNSLGSDLLFQARSGSLPTKHRESQLYNTKANCKSCNSNEETVQHILTECPAFQEERTQLERLSPIQQHQSSDEITTQWLGLNTSDRLFNQLTCNTTKQLLETWWNTAKNRRPYWRF